MKVSKAGERRFFTDFIWLWFFVILLVKSSFLLSGIYTFQSTIIFSGLFAVGPILFLLSFSLILSGKAQYIYLIITDALISMLFIADAVYARVFGHLLSFHIVVAATDVLKGLGNSIFALIKWTDLLYLADIPLLIIAASKIDWGKIKRKLIIFAELFILGVALICLQFNQLEGSKKLGNFRLHPLLMSPVGNHMFDIYSFLYEKKDPLTDEESAEISRWLNDNEKFLIPGSDFSELEGMLSGKNLIVIQFESLESFVIGKSFYGQEVTPVINRFLDSSIYFPNIAEQVMDGNSSDAELMFNTSLYPIRSGSAFIRFGDNVYPSLPKLLSDMGYTSVAIHGDDREFWNRDTAFPSLGFSRYIDETEFRNKANIGMGISDESLFDQTLLEIKKLKEPFNIFVITLTSHTPFDMKEDKYLDLPQEDISSDYLQSINYTDRMIGKFYEQLLTEGCLEDSVLIIYGDHEGIHKYYPDETSLPDNNQMMPFIIHIPGMKGIVSDKAGGQVDMMPTLAYLLGIDREKYAPFVMGRNLFGEYSGSALFSDGEITEGTDGGEHLAEAQRIADMGIRGDYFRSRGFGPQ